MLIGRHNPRMDIAGFKVKRKIGQGGMATAYLAEQESLGREVVLKVLDKRERDTDETIERFLNEGRIIASLNHPHIITIYDIGQNDGQVYLSMEYVEGGDLKQRLAKQTLTPPDALAIIEKVATGLEAAHAKGIVHRDVKPGNILFRRDGTPLLSDFGIAKQLSADSDLTSTGMFLGSPNYMAPEQSEASPIDGRADIYSLGVIFYEMVTGRRPYTAESVIDVIVMHKKDPVPTLPEELSDFQELLELMMAKRRRERFRDARALIHYIRELRRKGILKAADGDTTLAELELPSDADEDDSEGNRSTRIRFDDTKQGKKRSPWPQVVIMAMLITCMIGWGVLIVIERNLKREPRPVVQATVELDILAAPGAPGGVEVLPNDPAEAAKIQEALLWLGQHSIDELRLTAPPRDNAYYYFSRLLQMDPGNAAARDGLKRIVDQCTFLAEREIAGSRHQEALSYVSIGLQLDPDNQSLRVLRDLAAKPEGGFWDALGSLFSS